MNYEICTIYYIVVYIMQYVMYYIMYSQAFFEFIRTIWYPSALSSDYNRSVV